MEELTWQGGHRELLVGPAANLEGPLGAEPGDGPASASLASQQRKVMECRPLSLPSQPRYWAAPSWAVSREWEQLPLPAEAQLQPGWASGPQGTRVHPGGVWKQAGPWSEHSSSLASLFLL